MSSRSATLCSQAATRLGTFPVPSSYPLARIAPPASAEESVRNEGWGRIQGVLSEHECAALRSLYEVDDAFRSTVDMGRHGFGSGRYRYFGYPLPPCVEETRSALYRTLVPLANEWQTLRGAEPYPSNHAQYLRACHALGQLRPTPLLLRYRAEDYNRLHQDLYGKEVFPLQIVVLLSQPGRDFTGGELVLVEQKQRSQSRPIVVPLSLGDAAVFATDRFPVAGPRGHQHRRVRHGMSALGSGERFTLGLIFHDAT